MAEEAWKIGHKNTLEQFLLLAKNAKSAAAAHLIRQVTEAPGVYVFGELMQMPNLSELASGDYEKEWRLLNLFAYGKYRDFSENVDQYPELSPVQITKLRHLTIIALASSSRHIPYQVLLNELGMRSVRELEDLIIEVVYAGILLGKLDQKRQQLEIEFVIGRDIKPENVHKIESVLDAWCTNCEEVLQSLQRQIQRSNSAKEHNLRTKKQIEVETDNLKKAIVTQNSEMAAEDGDNAAMFQNQQYQKSQGKQNKMSKSILKTPFQGRGR